MNPHLFTHLFHEGVIVSTRKLVYDAGSNEESIKALMQAQHKAVMKDLKKGTFDEKIDQYLSAVPGLEPRAGAPAEAAPPPRGERAPTEISPPPVEATASPLEITSDDLSEPIELPIKGSRTETGDKTRPISMEPPGLSIDENAATLVGDGAAQLSAAFRAAQARTATEQDPNQPVVSRTGTAPRVSRTGSSNRPNLEIIEDEPSRGRMARDTTVELSHDVADGVPARTTQDSIPPPTTPVRAGNMPSHGAAALPPAKPPLRPSMSPPIVTRPVTGDRNRPDESEAVEIYQPAPGSVEPPPGERAERPGQYSVNRKSGETPLRDQSNPNRMAAINPGNVGQTGGVTKPGQTSPRVAAVVQQPSSGANRAPQNVPREPTPQNQMPRQGSQHPRSATPPLRGGTPQPVRPHVTAPIQNRTSSPATPPSGSGVVMTRPAVIVGAPPKSPSSPSSTQRVRKAREDEGRGFGQGLISEKSLDEVILAYLSEDAEDK